MSDATDQTKQAFLRATLSDDDLGYPDRVAFLSQDTDSWKEILLRTLVEEGRPVVLIDADASEVLFEPLNRRGPLRIVDRRLKRRRVRIRFRYGTSAYGIDRVTVVNRRTIEQLRLGAQAA